MTIQTSKYTRYFYKMFESEVMVSFLLSLFLNNCVNSLNQKNATQYRCSVCTHICIIRINLHGIFSPIGAFITSKLTFLHSLILPPSTCHPGNHILPSLRRYKVRGGRSKDAYMFTMKKCICVAVVVVHDISLQYWCPTSPRKKS